MVEIAVLNAEETAPIATVEGVTTVRAGAIVGVLNHAADRLNEDAALSAPIAEVLIAAGEALRGDEETVAAEAEAAVQGVTPSDATARRNAMGETSAMEGRRIVVVRPPSIARRVLRRRSARSARRPRRLARTSATSTSTP